MQCNTDSKLEHSTKILLKNPKNHDILTIVYKKSVEIIFSLRCFRFIFLNETAVANILNLLQCMKFAPAVYFSFLQLWTSAARACWETKMWVTAALLVLPGPEPGPPLELSLKSSEPLLLLWKLVAFWRSPGSAIYSCNVFDSLSFLSQNVGVLLPCKAAQKETLASSIFYGLLWNLAECQFCNSSFPSSRTIQR